MPMQANNLCKYHATFLRKQAEREIIGLIQDVLTLVYASSVIIGR